MCPFLQRIAPLNVKVGFVARNAGGSTNLPFFLILKKSTQMNLCLVTLERNLERMPGQAYCVKFAAEMIHIVNLILFFLLLA